ncbi:akirin-1 isoform X3 [Mirounga leonina]|uniref:akirin-1 isoform X3 n=1 Tax=Mirounga leonina TaxID=9715 RepID=UPI00156C4B3F|nr:akirin-1 isoform X3 [Mirounga leonina]
MPCLDSWTCLSFNQPKSCIFPFVHFTIQEAVRGLSKTFCSHEHCPHTCPFLFQVIAVPCILILNLAEQIFQNIKQEYSRYQRWRHLEVVLNQSEACTSESQPHSSALTAPSSPGSSWMKKDQPTFTLRQVGIICERLLKDYEDKIREEYEQILNTKLAEQYESFVKFTHDQIMRRYGTRPTSYVS